MSIVDDILIEALETHSRDLSNNGCNDLKIEITDESKRFLLKMADEYCDKEYAESLKKQIDSGEKSLYTYDWMVVGYLKQLVEKGKIKYVE